MDYTVSMVDNVSGNTHDIFPVIQQGLSNNEDAMQILHRIQAFLPEDNFWEPWIIPELETLQFPALLALKKELESDKFAKSLNSLQTDNTFLLLAQLSEVFWGYAFTKQLFDSFEPLWLELPRVVYKMALMEYLEGNYDKSYELVQTSKDLFEDSTRINLDHETGKNIILPVLLLHGKLLDYYGFTEQATQIFNEAVKIIVPFLSSQNLIQAHSKAIHRVHTVYAKHNYILANYEQTIFLLERLRSWYGSFTLNDEYSAILAQCYEFLGDLEKRDLILNIT